MRLLYVSPFLICWIQLPSVCSHEPLCIYCAVSWCEFNFSYSTQDLTSFLAWVACLSKIWKIFAFWKHLFSILPFVLIIFEIFLDVWVSHFYLSSIHLIYPVPVYPYTYVHMYVCIICHLSIIYQSVTTFLWCVCPWACSDLKEDFRCPPVSFSLLFTWDSSHTEPGARLVATKPQRVSCPLHLCSAGVAGLSMTLGLWTQVLLLCWATSPDLHLSLSLQAKSFQAKGEMQIGEVALFTGLISFSQRADLHSIDLDSFCLCSYGFLSCRMHALYWLLTLDFSVGHSRSLGHGLEWGLGWWGLSKSLVRGTILQFWWASRIFVKRFWSFFVVIFETGSYSTSGWPETHYIT